MRIHDTGPKTGYLDRERPFIDDEPAHGHGWDARLPWETRPARDLERELGRWGPAPTGFLRDPWTRVWRRNATSGVNTP